MVVEQDGIRRMPKLNSASNYIAWSIVIRSVLRSYLLSDILSGIDVMPPGFDKAGDKISKTFGKEKSSSSSTMVLAKIVVSGVLYLPPKARLPANNNFAFYYSIIADTT